MTEKFYRVYGRKTKSDRYRAMDTNTGNLVNNLIYATFFMPKDLPKVKKYVKKLKSRGFDAIIKDNRGNKLKKVV